MGSLTSYNGKLICSSTITGMAFNELEYHINDSRREAGKSALSKAEVVNWLNHHFNIVLDVASFGAVETAVRERIYNIIVEKNDSEELEGYSPENKLIAIDDYVYVVRAELKPELYKAMQAMLNTALSERKIPPYDDHNTIHWLNKSHIYPNTVANMLLFQDPDDQFMQIFIKNEVDEL